MKVSVRMIKKIKATKFCDIIKFIHDLTSINNGEEFGTNYCNIYLEKLEGRKKNNVKHEAKLLDLDIEIMDGKLQIGLFNK